MRNQFVHAKIEDIIEHNETTKSFVLDDLFNSKPGQFVMAWLPGVDEKPISLSGKERITVKKVGPFTEKLFEKKVGNYLDIRGPYGNGFTPIAFSTVIGGGCGIAPLFYLASETNLPAWSFVLAGKTKDDLLFLDDILKLDEKSPHYVPHKIVAVTEDGSYGTKGLVTDVEIPQAKGSYKICGPEIMMKKVSEKLVNEGVNPEKIFLSMERYMKCAVGICGNCSFDGYRVCADGPVFRYDKVKDLPHFNEYARSRTGEIKTLEELKK